jgi:protein-S-isoprenylcysteine O-methyltransferase Ste14
MSTERPFRIAFWALFGGSVIMQVYFALRVRLAGERVAASSKSIEREGRGCAVIRRLGTLTLVAFLVLYVIDPPWLGVLSVPFPEWLRWTGVALGVTSIGLHGWCEAALGREWSPHLRTRDQHRLTVTGPYARIRHPIYVALTGFLTSLALVTANWLLVARLVIHIIILAFRVPREEQMMIEEFGQEYEAYMRTTGRFVPR